MDISAHDLEKLKCSSCGSYLSRGLVFLQHDGAAACGRCSAPKRPATRNVQYETTAKYLRFPCKNRDLGCRETVPFVDEKEEIAHEEVCEHRQYVCPVLGSARCDWLGTRQDMLQHCTDQHPDKVVGNPTTLVHDISKASAQTYLLRAFEILFLLHTKVCLVSGKIFHAVRYLETSDEATSYNFTLDIKRNDLCISKPGIVAPQGCLVMQEPTSLALDKNGLLSVLEGFAGTTFTVTVQRKVDQQARRVAVVQCAGCEAEVTGFRFRDADGWRCNRCAPAKRACENHGCTHTDIYSKSNKHEEWFCQQRTQCWICWVTLPRGTLSAHYGSVHQDITYRAGSTWRVTQTDWSRRDFLLSSAAGTAGCWYRLRDTQFVLWVYIPVPSERLREFRCVVQVSNPATGQARTYTPDIEYSELYDWHIEVKKEDFQPWNTQFDVSVDIMQSE